MVAGKGRRGGPKRGQVNGEDQRCLASEGASGKGEPRAASRVRRAVIKATGIAASRLGLNVQLSCRGRQAL
jgi:hypothetical protein